LRRPDGLVGMLIFELMDKKPRYGYELLRKFDELSGGYWQPGQGTVYGALERLEECGLIEKVDNEEGEDSESNRQYYGLTEAGRKELEERKQFCDEKIKPIDRILGLIYVYRFLAEDEDFEELITKIDREFLNHRDRG